MVDSEEEEEEEEEVSRRPQRRVCCRVSVAGMVCPTAATWWSCCFRSSCRWSSAVRTNSTSGMSTGRTISRVSLLGLGDGRWSIGLDCYHVSREQREKREKKKEK